MNGLRTPVCPRKNAVTAAHGLALSALLWLTAGGCDEVTPNWGPEPQHAPRPEPMPISSATQPAAGRPGCELIEADFVPPARCYYQVVLLQETAPDEVPPGVEYVQLAHAPAQRLGEIVAWLYPPCGPAGDRDRYCLVYPSAAEARQAAEWSRQLDMSPLAPGKLTTQPEGDDKLAAALGGLLALPEAARLTSVQSQHLEDRLDAALVNGQLPQARRWAAGIIAARLAEKARNDLTAAARRLTEAEALTDPGSLERQSTIYAQACIELSRGHQATANQLFRRVRDDFANLRNTEVYSRVGYCLDRRGGRQ